MKTDKDFQSSHRIEDRGHLIFDSDSLKSYYVLGRNHYHYYFHVLILDRLAAQDEFQEDLL